MHRHYTRFSSLLALMLFFAGPAAAQDKQATYKSAPQFVLSQAAVDAGIDGMVMATLSVSKDGSVKDVDILGGPSWPCESSPDAVIQAVHKEIRQNLMSARFQPALNDGKPVDASVRGEFPIGPTYRSSLKEEAARKLADSGTSSAMVDAGIVNGRAVELPRPSYPMSVRGSGGGTIRVQVLIDEMGTVISAGSLQGQAALRKAARAAACRARFSPTMLAGRPVRVWGLITYHYR